MSKDEIELEYINMKVEYEHKKNVLSIFMISILIAVLMDGWKYFFTFVEKIMEFSGLYQEGGREAVKVVFACSVLGIVFISVLFFSTSILYIKRMHKVYRKMLIIKEIKERDKGKTQ